MDKLAEQQKDGIKIGWAIEDITPEGPVSLFGQYYERMSAFVESPLTVTVFAVESLGKDGRKEQVIMASVDIAYILRSFQDALKNMLKDLIPDFDTAKLFLNATHTHCAPYPDIESDFGKLLLNKLAKAAVDAWNSRRPAGISNAYGYAVVGHNRRVIYADGTAEMYGATDRPDYIGIEGPSDHGVDMLFCWDANKELTGIIINVSCPSQVVEGKYYVSADYWSEVRKQIRERFSKDIFVLPQCGAAGDISPRDLTTGYKTDEPNMWDLPGMVEIGRRITKVVDEAYSEAKNNIQTNVIFKHSVKNITLPTRRISREEYEKAAAIVNDIRSREPKDPDSPDTAWNRFLCEIKENEKIKAFGPWDSKTSDYGWLRPQELVLQQFENQDRDTGYSVELHAIRLGEVAFASNPFELFVNYGFIITGRSYAKQVFIVQLSGDYGGYLPTQKALEAGGYSAMAVNIGPPGGEVLIKETIDLVNKMWSSVKQAK